MLCINLIAGCKRGNHTPKQYYNPRAQGAPELLRYLSYWPEYQYSDQLRLLLGNCDREDQIAWADVVYNINTLDDLAEAGVYAVEVLGIHAVVADEEL